MKPTAPALLLLVACGPTGWEPPAAAAPVPVYGSWSGLDRMRLRIGDSECLVVGEPREREHFCDLPKALPQGDRLRFRLELSWPGRQVDLEREVSVPPAAAWSSVWVYAYADAEPEVMLARIIAPPEDVALEAASPATTGAVVKYRVTNRRPQVLWPKTRLGIAYGGELFVSRLNDEGAWTIDRDPSPWANYGLKELLPGETASLDTYAMRAGWTRFSTWVREQAELEPGVFLQTQYLLVDEVLVTGSDRPPDFVDSVHSLYVE